MIPIATDRPIRQTPVVNYALMASCVAIAVAQSVSPALQSWLHTHFALYPASDPPVGILSGYAHLHHFWQFLTYQFLHADAWHLLGNMLFLWVFGNAVEDRVGSAAYLLFYLAVGAMAGLVQVVLDGAPTIGASGSIAGVTGAFLAFFPLTRVRILWFFILIGTFEVSAVWVILFALGRDLFFQILGGGQVAYMAHISGTIAGFAFGIAILSTRILPREPYDMMTMVTQWRRRRQFASMAEQGFDPWRGRKGTADVRSPWKPNSEHRPDHLFPPEVYALRTAVIDALSRGDRPAALEAYRQLLLKHAGAAALGREQQLAVANALFAEGDHARAAEAYRIYLKQYPTAGKPEQVQLLLGLILTRYVRQAEEARPLLTAAIGRLTNEADRALARSLLEELRDGSSR